VLLGRQGTAESKAEYARVIAEWQAVGGLPVAPVGRHTDVSVNEMLLAFLKHADRHYRHPDGTPTSELKEYFYSLRPVRELYGHAPAREFTPLALKAVRRRMVEAGWCRGVVNQRVGRVKRAFKCAASEDLIPGAVYQNLRTVNGLRAGHSDARETEPVRPVRYADVDAVLQLVLPPRCRR
jgi:hypothetical protein